MISYDGFAEAERIACHVDSSNHSKVADAIRIAIASSSRATEIPMDLRHGVFSAVGGFRGTSLEAEFRTLQKQVSVLLDSGPPANKPMKRTLNSSVQFSAVLFGINLLWLGRVGGSIQRHLLPIR